MINLLFAVVLVQPLVLVLAITIVFSMGTLMAAAQQKVKKIFFQLFLKDSENFEKISIKSFKTL